MSFPAAAQPYEAAVAGMSEGCRFAVYCCPAAQWIIDGVPPGASQPAIAVAAAPGGTVLGAGRPRRRHRHRRVAAAVEVTG